jgi:hypothetical protein
VVVKKTMSPGARILRLDRFPHPILIAHFPRQPHAVPTEHVLSEPAAIEAARIGAAVAIRRAAQRQRRAGHGIAVKP